MPYGGGGGGSGGGSGSGGGAAGGTAGGQGGSRAYTLKFRMGNRGVFGGGMPSSITPVLDVIDYINISTIGNAADFGNLTEARDSAAACSDGS